MIDIQLTDRQKQVIDLTSNGYTDKEIAHELGVSVSMVQQHLKVVSEKLGAKNVKQAIALYVRQQLIMRIRNSGREDTMRAFILREAGADSLDELSMNDSLLEVCKYFSQVLDRIGEEQK